MVKRARASLGNHVEFVRKLTSNAFEIRAKDVRLTFDEMRRAGHSAARAIIPSDPEVLIGILSDNAAMVNAMVYSVGHGSTLKAILQSTISDGIVKNMEDELLTRYEGQYDDLDLSGLTDRAREMRETLLRISVPTPSFYSETYGEALQKFEADANESTLNDLSFVSVAYVDYMKTAGEREIARRVVEEMDFVSRHPERFVLPSLAPAF
jgi:hypothetical protein